MLKKVDSRFLKVLVTISILTAFLLLFMVTGAYADGDGIAGIADTLTGATDNIYQLALSAALLIGFIVVVIGFVKLNSQRQQQQGVGGAVMMIIVGFLLVSIGAVLGAGSETFFGKDESEVMEHFQNTE